MKLLLDPSARFKIPCKANGELSNRNMTYIFLSQRDRSGQSRKSETLPLLTDARGIAALLIVHVHLISGYLPIHLEMLGAFQWVVRNGYLAVDFFFVLSGFVLAHVYRARFLHSMRAKSVWEFLIARFARIYPLHFFASASFFIVAARVNAIWDWKHFAHDLLLVNSLPTLFPLNVPSWSISAEFISYLFAPAMIALAPRLRAWCLLAAMMAGGFVLTYFVEFRWKTLDYHSAIRCFPEFFYGVICYEFSVRRPLSGREAACAVLASILVMAVCLWNESLGFGARGTPSPLLAFIIALGPLIAGLTRLPCAATRRMTVRPLKYLGKVSFSVYLLHPLVFMCLPLVKARLKSGGLADYRIETIAYFIGLMSLLLAASASFFG